MDAKRPWVRPELALWVLFIFGARQLGGQVPAVLELRHGEASALIGNPTREAVRVTVELWYGAVVDQEVVLGREVRALVAPATFALQPGERQALRLRVKEPVPAGTVLRLVVTFTPVAGELTAPGDATAAVARVVLATRLITKVLVP